MRDDMSIVDWLYLFDKIDTETWLIWGYVIPGVIVLVLFAIYLYLEWKYYFLVFYVLNGFFKLLKLTYYIS